MTDTPKTGFLCAGKNPLELSVSVHCAHKLMETLKNSGFATGSCYTEICEYPTPEKIKHTAKTLSRLCLTNDLVITVGCEGFASGDIIPDITDAVCPKKAVYFSNVLCGSLKISSSADIDNTGNSSGSPMRIFPDEARTYNISPKNSNTSPDRLSFSAKLDCALQKLSKHFSENSDDTNLQHLTDTDITYGSVMKIMNKSARDSVCGSMPKTDTGYDKKKNEKDGIRRKSVYFPSSAIKDSSAVLSYEYFEGDKNSPLEVPPSRSSAGICENALVLNLSNDVYTAVKLVKALVPAIGFTVYNISGKSAAAALQYEKSLKSSPECKDFFKKCSVVND